MTTPKKIQKKISTEAKVAIGVSALALAAATYYFFGPDGKKHRHNLRGWMIRMKGEIVEHMEKAKDVTETVYHKIVDAVAARYKNSGIPEEDLRAFVADLKKHWQGFAAARSARKATAKAKSAATAKKRSAKKASKKA